MGKISMKGVCDMHVHTNPDLRLRAYDDFQLADAAEGADVIDGTLAHGRFALFVAGEPHMPTLTVPGATPAAVKKICFKVLGDKFWDE